MVFGSKQEYQKNRDGNCFLSPTQKAGSIPLGNFWQTLVQSAFETEKPRQSFPILFSHSFFIYTLRKVFLTSNPDLCCRLSLFSWWEDFTVLSFRHTVHIFRAVLLGLPFLWDKPLQFLQCSLIKPLILYSIPSRIQYPNWRFSSPKHDRRMASFAWQTIFLFM